MRPPLSKNSPDGLRLAFTLAELLVSVAIVAVLAALSVGVALRMSLSGKETVNLANHRQIVGALIAYAGEHGGRLPLCYEDSATTKKMTYTRKLVLLGYIAQPRIFFGPLEQKWYEKEGANALRSPASNATVPWFYTNYGVNRYGAMPYDSSTDGSRKPASLIRVAAEGRLSALMLLRDNYDKSYPDRGGGNPWFTNAAKLPTAAKNYHGRVYASFADGHVEAFGYGEIKALMEKPNGEPPLFKDLYTRQ